MHNPLVSVIIPNYCHARYLDQRIQSVLGQTYQNFEVIILDDRSPDDGASRAVIEKYRHDPHVSHIEYNEVNSGSTFKQWHKGFELAKGELIWIAESDDYCESTLLEKCVAEFEKEKDIALVHSTSILVDAENKEIDYGKDAGEAIPEGIYDGKEFITRYLCKSCSIWNASAVVFRKDFALKAPKEYMEYKAAGDHRFWVEMSLQGKVVHLAEHLNYYRQHEQKVTDKSFDNGTTHKEGLRTLLYIKQQGLISPTLERAAYRKILNEILCWKYDNDNIRKELLILYRQANFSAYLYARVRLWIAKIHKTVE